MASIAEEEVACDRVPVTVLTGFLGSGKTTLLNHILTATHGKKIAIIENEFGAVAIDDKLLAKNTKFQTGEEIFEVLNGCMCCTVRTDLVKVLHKLASRIDSGKLVLDGIILETTGMADPSPVVQTFLVDPIIRKFARIDGVVTLVDAKHIEKRGINGFAPILRCSHSNVSVDSVLQLHGFDLKRTLEAVPNFLDPGKAPTVHDARIKSVSLDQGGARHLRKVQLGELDLELVQSWIGELLEKRGEDIFRMKGVLAIAHAEQRFIFHAVHMVMEVRGRGPVWSSLWRSSCARSL